MTANGLSSYELFVKIGEQYPFFQLILSLFAKSHFFILSNFRSVFDDFVFSLLHDFWLLSFKNHDLQNSGPKGPGPTGPGPTGPGPMDPGPTGLGPMGPGPSGDARNAENSRNPPAPRPNPRLGRDKPVGATPHWDLWKVINIVVKTKHCERYWRLRKNIKLCARY